MQVVPAAFVADPAGDADVQAEFEVGLQFGLATGEAVGYALQRAAMFAQRGDEVLVGVALVQEKWPPGLRRERQLQRESLALGGCRREIAVVVEAAFAGRHHLGFREQRTQARQLVFGEFAGMVRMHASRGVQAPRVRTGQSQRGGARGHGGTRDDQLGNAGGARAREDLLAIAIEAVVREVYAYVDEPHGRGSLHRAPRRAPLL